MTVVKTYATFWTICILWSFWTSESLASGSRCGPPWKAPYTAEVLCIPRLVLVVILLGEHPEPRRCATCEDTTSKTTAPGHAHAGYDRSDGWR